MPNMGFDKPDLCHQLLLLACICVCLLAGAQGRRPNGNLTACQHLRRIQSRHAKAYSSSQVVRIPRCNKSGDFEKIQCLNEKSGENCWCIDEYGVEIPGTRNIRRSTVHCAEPEHCKASACRMFCPAGFDRDRNTGCSVCRCRDICEGVKCPNGQLCQLQEVKCKTEPCPPVPSCKKSRSVVHYCPAGMPLAIADSTQPFLCGLEEGKPQCPLLYRCIIESGNDYGVCCPNTPHFEKPGLCPKSDKVEFNESTGYLCGVPCSNDLECPNMEKCCFTKGCQSNCQPGYNVTACHRAQTLANLLAINEREGRGYDPDCSGPNGLFFPRQCSRNGLVCWCVDPRTGHKIQDTMGAAANVNCEGWENMISRSVGRSIDLNKCDTNICAAICEYGFKNDHNGCPTCECSEPCEGFKCAIGSHCEVAVDPLCASGSALCASWPVCKPDLVYSNPCDFGTPLADNLTGEVSYCIDERQSRLFQPIAFFEPEIVAKQSRSMTNHIKCPVTYKCTKLSKDTESVCCPLPEETTSSNEPQVRQQTMCEYLRDFSERMEGTEEGMQLAIPAPRCTDDGIYLQRQCTMKKIRVTRSEQRRILEENTIRRMRMLLKESLRTKRDVERLKLYRVDDSALKVEAGESTSDRSAKVIDIGADRVQSLGQIYETEFKKSLPASKGQNSNNELVDIDVEECWCVDSFGTEIPKSRNFNVTEEFCVELREQIDCLDLTCRMGCEYGFTLDPDTRCPACQCRDPCEGITCGEGKECRIVDVSCDEEYCPPVPACLPRKPGQCPYLVPPGPDNLDTNTCAYECRTDSHCDGLKRCCSNGCGTQCVLPQMKTACQHLRAIQMHQSSELGIPAKKMHIAQCNQHTGKWNPMQCSPDGICWCVNEQGEQLSGSRVKGTLPVCTLNSAFNCTVLKCDKTCDSGLKTDENGCSICECRNFCDAISCANSEECQLISVECIDMPCPKMPICVPRRASVCPEGNPLKQGDLEVSCGPHNDNQACPTTHICQLNPVTHRGVCCSKTRDVCFESMDNSCVSKLNSQTNSTRYRFSPKANKCVAISIDLNVGQCQTKNLFHSELACNSVCPVLTSCERLKLKNHLAAQRTGFSSVWFQPRCDPITGHWSPVQCLHKQPTLSTSHTVPSTATTNRKHIPDTEPISSPPYGVCWCADKKGAPLKGTLTRDIEPACNSREARQRKSFDTIDPLMEELIKQITILNDVNDFGTDDKEEETINFDMDSASGVATKNDSSPSKTNLNLSVSSFAVAPGTEQVFEVVNSLLSSQLSVETLKPIKIQTTRCRSLVKTAPFPVSCDKNGAFLPIQCNNKLCWCVDAAGNQLDSSNMFRKDAQYCQEIPIDFVMVELLMINRTNDPFRNVYDKIRKELYQLLGDELQNLRVQENFDGSVALRFELHGKTKVDLAFAIELAIHANKFILLNGYLQPDITRSYFIHHSTTQPLNSKTVSSESTIQLVLFIMATSSAFLVSVFVVYVMLRRGKHTKVDTQYGYPIFPAMNGGDKAVDFTAPIFVLSTHDDGANQKSKTRALKEDGP